MQSKRRNTRYSQHINQKRQGKEDNSPNNWKSDSNQEKQPKNPVV